MSDTLKVMEVVDSLAQVTDLEGACRVLISSPALGRPFHAVTLGLVDERARLSEIARYNFAGFPDEFRHLRLWEESLLSRIMASGKPSVVLRGHFHALHPDIRYSWADSPFESVYVFPVGERGVPYGAVFLFSREIFDQVDLTDSHRDMLATSIKMVLRSHEWRHGLHPVDSGFTERRAG